MKLSLTLHRPTKLDIIHKLEEKFCGGREINGLQGTVKYPRTRTASVVAVLDFSLTLACPEKQTLKFS